jgi:hypothetical protein
MAGKMIPRKIIRPRSMTGQNHIDTNIRQQETKNLRKRKTAHPEVENARLI